MKRREVTKNLVAGVATVFLRGGAALPKPIDVALSTDSGGQHLDLYFQSLAATVALGYQFVNVGADVLAPVAGFRRTARAFADLGA
jgi:hypothetical protein